MLNGPDYVLDLAPPDCDADGYYSPKQCDIFHGFCRCVDKEGNQIGDYNGFVTDVQMGQDGTWDDSTCACAREADDITSQTPRPGMFVPRCDWKGDYDNIQCRGSMCYCVDDNLQQVGESVNRWEEHLLNCDGRPIATTPRPLPPTFRPRPPTFPTLPPRGCLYGGQFYPPGSTIYETTGCMGSGARCDENGQVLVWDNFGFGCCERNGQYYEDGTTITEGDVTCTCVGSDGAMPAPMACTGPPTAEPIGPIPPTLPPTYLFGICDDNSCFNSGVCEQVPFGSYYTCTCPPAGASDAGDCNSSPCLNDANCWDIGIEGYMCECRLGYDGPRCENYNDPCQAGNNPCQNGGTCLYDNWVGYPYCQCPPDFTGKECETLFPTSCDDSSCQNGGTCTRMPCDWPGCTAVEESWCTCAAGFTGYTCEFLFGICDDSSCFNSGVCEQVPFESYYKCTCPPGEKIKLLFFFIC
ncbi:NOTCH2 [Branchiostoma lanceolatum]|nr:NOTCH2 [Branchiostoma lanceolatum]